MRTNFDFAPYRRSTVGFDRLFDLLETRPRGDGSDGYPPFDIARDGEDSYRITLAVPGYRPSDIEIVAQQNQLTVTGKRAQEEGQYIHRGIATRPFERRFQLADFVEVGAADMANGLLSIALKRVVPEAMKPRTVAISAGESQRRIEPPTAAGQEAA